MASRSESAEAILQQLLGVGGHTGDLRVFPLMVAITAPPPPAAGDSAPPPANHFMLINPVTQQAVMLQGDLAEMLMEEGGNPGVPPASRAAIKGLRTVEVGEVEKGKNCPVCLDEYGAEMEVKEMPCKHRFHEGCIEKWLGMHGSCPVCRFQMSEVPAEERPGRSAGGFNHSAIGLQIAVEESGITGSGTVWGRGWRRFDHGRVIGVRQPVEAMAAVSSTGWGLGWRRFDHNRAISHP